MIKAILKKILATHWVSLIGIAILSICLKIALNYSFILSFLVLLVAYFIIGILVEYGMEQMSLAKGKQYLQAGGKAPETKESAEPVAKANQKNETQRPQTGYQLPVRQKKNTPSCAPSGGLEKLERTRAQFVDLSPDEEEDRKIEHSLEATDFMIRTHQMYRTNQARNKAEQQIRKEAEEEAVTQVEVTPIVSSVQPVCPARPEPVPVQVKTQETPSVLRTHIPEMPDPIQTPDDLEQISDDLSKEIDRRIEENQQTVTRRKRDYSIPRESVLHSPSEPSPAEIPVRRPLPVIKPVFFSDTGEEKVSPTAAPREANYTDDKVHSDRTMVDALFEMSHTSESSHTAPARKPVTQINGFQHNAAKSAIPVPADYDIPSIDLLRGGKMGVRKDAEQDGESDPRAKKLIDTLESFGVGAKVTAVIKGPAVTRYEIQPNPGVKVSRIVSLSDDISLNLAATGVRIEAPIPGKEAVGIEVPNREVEIVYLKDVIDSPEYKASSSNLTFAIGKDIAGTNIVHDIAKMPHLLIAGATGAGKSVCINTIIASILYKSGPEHVRMIMIDPKIVELGVYNGIPHLLVPVVTNPKKAAAALAWAVGEMERRYSEFSQYNVRDIRAFNALAAKRKTLTAMPQIVIIIDELADLMMVAAKEIEDSIIRLAQKARAAGLHLIIATQRPSVDVITGLIKANIPSRIAFAVSSQVDSRTILDGSGAEKLLGRGDMLFHPIGMSKPLRVQGAFVSDGEIEALVSDIKRSCGTVTYSEEIQASMEAKMNSNTNQNSGGSSGGDEDDCDTEVIQAAAELAFEYKQLSTSFLQRKLKLGYSRASRVVDALERMGVISGSDGSKPRQLLITREQWEAMQ